MSVYVDYQSKCECECECKGQPEKTHLLVDAASALFYSVDASLSD